MSRYPKTSLLGVIYRAEDTHKYPESTLAKWETDAFCRIAFAAAAAAAVLQQFSSVREFDIGAILYSWRPSPARPIT